MKNLALLFLILSFNFSSAQSPLVKQWDYRFGGGIDDWFASCIETNDNGYLLGGSSNSNTGGDIAQPNCDFTLNTFDYWVVKTDSANNILWESRFGGSGEDALSTVLEVSNGFILAGTSSSQAGCLKTQPLKGYNDYYVVKTDMAGNKVRERDYGGLGGNLFACALKLNDDAILLGGSSTSDDNGDKSQPNRDSTLNTYDFWIVKTDSSGSIIWDKTFGGNKDETLASMASTSDGGFILGGTSNSGVSGDKSQPNWDTTLHYSDYWIVKIDSMGNKEWDKTFGGLYWETLASLRQTDDGGYILFGSAYSGISGDKTESNWDTTFASDDYWIVKTDASGNKLWDKRYGGTGADREGDNIIFTPDSGYLFAGISYSDSSGDHSDPNIYGRQCWIVKADANGSKLWDKSIQVPGTSENCTSLLTKDNCFLFPMSVSAGIGLDKTQPSQGADDYWFIKYCDSTFTTGVWENKYVRENLLLAPNPTTGIFEIKNENLKNESIRIYSILGEELMIPSLHIPNSSAETNLDITSLPSGIYILQATDGKNILRGKVVKE